MKWEKFTSRLSKYRGFNPSYTLTVWPLLGEDKILLILKGFKPRITKFIR